MEQWSPAFEKTSAISCPDFYHRYWDFPYSRPPVVVQVPKKEGLKPRTVRLLAPQFYRKFLPGVSAEDTPKTIITAWAQALGCQAARLTGGSWQMVSHTHMEKS